MGQDKIVLSMNTDPQSLRVECYAGYRGEETPRRFHSGDKTVEVIEVIDRWLAPEHQYFKVCGDDGGLYLLRYDIASDLWDMTMFDSGRRGDTRASSI